MLVATYTCGLIKLGVHDGARNRRHDSARKDTHLLPPWCSPLGPTKYQGRWGTGISLDLFRSKIEIGGGSLLIFPKLSKVFFQFKQYLLTPHMVPLCWPVTSIHRSTGPPQCVKVADPRV